MVVKVGKDVFTTEQYGGKDVLTIGQKNQENLVHIWTFYFLKKIHIQKKRTHFLDSLFTERRLCKNLCIFQYK